MTETARRYPGMHHDPGMDHGLLVIRASDFLRHSDFVIRHFVGETQSAEK